jgi:hypothetical protein
MNIKTILTLVNSYPYRFYLSILLIFFLITASCAQEGDASTELYEKSYLEGDTLIIDENAMSSSLNQGEDTTYIAENEEEYENGYQLHYPDSTVLSWKKFDEDKLKKLVDEGGFEYMEEEKKEAGSGLGVGELVGLWLQNLLQRFFSTPETRENTRTSIYIISIIIMVLVIAQIFRGELRSLFYGSGKKTKTNTYSEEKDLPTETLNEELEKAILEKDFSKAIRISYILKIRHLADKGFIRWKIDKTNHEYEFEIIDKSIKKQFSEATYYYEYVCYGGFTVDEQLFQKAKSVMNYK